MTRFRYRAERSPLGRITRPIATVFISSGSVRGKLAMYIYSGADISMIPFRFGKAIGLRQTPRDTLREIGGISGGAVPYLLKRVDLGIGRTQFPVRIAWTLIEEVPLLLGRMDVFSRFRILFDERRGFVEFEDAG